MLANNLIAQKHHDHHGEPDAVRQFKPNPIVCGSYGFLLNMADALSERVACILPEAKDWEYRSEDYFPGLSAPHVRDKLCEALNPFMYLRELLSSQPKSLDYAWRRDLKRALVEEVQWWRENRRIILPQIDVSGDLEGVVEQIVGIYREWLRDYGLTDVEISLAEHLGTLTSHDDSSVGGGRCRIPAPSRTPVSVGVSTGLRASGDLPYRELGQELAKVASAGAEAA